MHIATARAILATPSAESSADAIFRADAGLIWAEHGEEVEQWNAVASTQGWGEITVRSEDGLDHSQRFFYTYKGKESQCPVEGDRDDNLRSIHAMAEMVKADAEFRACIDVCGNSEWAFVTLSPEQWQALEAEFGAETLAFRFTPVKGTFEEFCVEYFRDENLRHYGTQEPDPAEEALGKLTDDIDAVGKAQGLNIAANYTLVLGTHLNILVVSETRQECNFLFKDEDFRRQVTVLCQELSQRFSYHLACIAFLSQEEMEEDEEGKWTFGWMTPGACSQIRFKVPPYAVPGGQSEEESEEGAPSTWQNSARAFARKHWLPIAFFTFMLAVLVFGQH